MKILVISGDHPRHLYLTAKLQETQNNIFSIIMKREKLNPIKSKFKKNIKNNLLVKHFKDRELTEKKYFNLSPDTSKIYNIKKKNLNSEKMVNFLQKKKFEIAVVFGVGMLKKEIIELLPRHTINVHLGLSPRYKGTATLFWPFYFLEPQYAGFTFHKLSQNPDSGAILHQGVPKLIKGDKIHTVSCKVVIKACIDLVKLINIFRRKKWTYKKQISSGKNFISKDFSSQHLEVIYKLYQNKIVDLYLKKKFSQKKPKIINFFKSK